MSYHKKVQRDTTIIHRKYTKMPLKKRNKRAGN
jgi:hypothetical protein